MGSTSSGPGASSVLQLADVAYLDFLLLHPEETAEQAASTLRALEPSHLIVPEPGTERPEAFFLFTTAETLDRLTTADPDLDLATALDLTTSEPTPTLDAAADAEGAPSACIVLRDGRPIGFVDSNWNQPDPLRSLTELRRAETLDRHLTAEYPLEVKLGQTFSLLVSLAAEPRGSSLLMSLPSDSVVEVLVRPRRGFSLVGPREASFTVSDTVETLPFQFRLRAEDPGPGLVEILAFHQGLCLGSLRVAPMVMETAVGSARSGLAEGPLDRLPTSQADLTLVILEERTLGGIRLHFRLHTRESTAPTGEFVPTLLLCEPRLYFEGFFQDLEMLRPDPEESAIVEEKLAAKGSHLFTTVLPPALKAWLWEHRGELSSILIQSDEPWIPWELCRLCGPQEGEGVIEAGFLGELFSITRWLLTDRSPAFDLRLQKPAWIVTQDAGCTRDSSRPDAADFHATGRLADLIPPEYLAVRQALASGDYSAIHFDAHASYRAPNADRSPLRLADASLTPEDLAGRVTNLRRARPLVFLNACQTGRASYSLTGLGGWGPAFLRAGAAAFLGTYWSVFNQPAKHFAKVFYRQLLEGQNLGQSVQQARLAVRQGFPGDPSWLAYTAFGAAKARLA